MLTENVGRITTTGVFLIMSCFIGYILEGVLVICFIIAANFTKFPLEAMPFYCRFYIAHIPVATNLSPVKIMIVLPFSAFVLMN
jgi:hypothetical protein